MTEYVFSPSENAFYLSALKDDYLAAGTWPTDGVSVKSEVAVLFMGEVPEGKLRGVKKGMPCWIDIPPPTQEDLIETAESDKKRRIEEANNYINSKQWPGKAAIGRLKEDDLKRYNLWLDYLDALEAVDTSEPQKIIWPATPED